MFPTRHRKPQSGTGNIPFESYVKNATSSVNRTAAPPFELIVMNLNYYLPMSDYAGLVTKTVGEDTPR